MKKFVEQARIACQIPGIAIGIVQDGKIVLEEGFGVCNIETQEKVTPETLFMIGSVTKPLTTCMMAKLIDEGFFNWDTLVTKILPTFAVDDENLTKQLTMRDMVNHANGIVVHKNIFTNASVTSESYIAAMRYVKPTTKLGQAYQYSNAMVAAGGYIAAHAAYPNLDFNVAYQKAMQHYLFDADILNDGFGSLKITGKTTEGLDLVIYYDIAHKRIKSHYPDSEKF